MGKLGQAITSIPVVGRVLGHIGHKHRLALHRPFFLQSALLGMVLFFFAISFMLNCARYAETYHYTPQLHDIVLNALPVIDVNAISTYGIELFIWTFYFMTLLLFPERFPFTIKAFALFKILRGVCLVMTNLGPPFDMVEDGYPGSTFGGMFFTKDLFFSGHTGYPIMAALVFWDVKWMRYVGIFAGLFLGFTALLMHDHYTIDIVGAVMACPLVYLAARWMFRSDFDAALHPFVDGQTAGSTSTEEPAG